MTELEKRSFKAPEEDIEKLEEIAEEHYNNNFSEAVREGVDAVLRHHGKKQPVRIKPDREVRA